MSLEDLNNDADLELHLTGDANEDGTGDANDASGNAYNFSWLGTPAYAAANVGKAFEFDGTNFLTRANGGVGLGIPTTTGAFTKALKFTPDSVTGIQMLFKSGGAVNGQTIYLDGSDVVVVFNGDASIHASLTAAGAASVGVPVIVCAVFDLDNDLLSLYINGALAASTAIATNVRSNSGSDPASIGATDESVRLADGTTTNSGGDYHFCTGTIEDIRLYLRSLTASEAAVLAGVLPPAIYHLPLTDNAATNVVTESAGSGETFVLKDNSGAVNTADRSQPASQNTVADRHLVLTGDDRVSGPLTTSALTAMTIGEWVASDQINTLGAQLFILDTDPVSGNYAASISSDDGSLSGGGRLRVILKNSSGTSLVDVVTNDRIFIDAAMHFVAVTYDQTNACRVFVDGSEQTLTGTNTVGTIRSITDGNLNLGSRENGTNPANTSKHYNFKFYDVVLTETQMAAWMAEILAAGGLVKGVVQPLRYDIRRSLTDIPSAMLPRTQ